MLKVTNLKEIKNIENPILMEYIRNKVTTMMEEYQVDNLDDIGCFVILENSENQNFVTSEMEFTEVLEIGDKTYLHGVKIISDSYAEDIFMPVEVVKC